MAFAGLQDVDVEDASVFQCCINRFAQRQRYLQNMGGRRPRHDSHGMRPDLSVLKYPFARSPEGPSQHHLFDVKTLGALAIYHRPYRIQPMDQRAKAVSGEYLRSAIDCDRTWNGTLLGSVRMFEAYMRSLPPVIGLTFGAVSEWSKKVDTLIGQLAEIASGVT